MNGVSVCVLPVLGKAVRGRERSCRITPLGPERGYSSTLSLFLSSVTGSLVQPYQPLSLYPVSFYPFSPPHSSLAHSISSYYLSFPHCLSLSPPPPPLFSPYLSLYGKAVNSLPSLLHCPSLLSLSLSVVFQWLCKLSNLIADKVINTTLASLNIHHSALCMFLLCFSEHSVGLERGGLLNNGRRNREKWGIAVTQRQKHRLLFLQFIYWLDFVENQRIF